MVRLARVCRPPAVRRGEPGSGGRGVLDDVGALAPGTPAPGSWHPAAEPRRHPSRHDPGHLATTRAISPRPGP